MTFASKVFSNLSSDEFIAILSGLKDTVELSPTLSTFIFKELIYLGDHIRTRVEVCGNDQFIVKVPNSYQGSDLKEGATVKLSWKASDSRALDIE